MAYLSKILVLFAAAGLITALPGNKISKPVRPDPYHEDDNSPVLTLTAGQPGTCSTSRWYIPTTIYQPMTTISTISTDVASPYTSYVPVTSTSTLAAPSVVTSVFTSTITTTAYVTTIVPTTYCYASDVTSVIATDSVVFEPSTSIYTASGVYSTYVTSSASLGQSWVPSFSYSECVVTATITSRVPTSTVSCAPVQATLTLGSPGSIPPGHNSGSGGYKPGSGSGGSGSGDYKPGNGNGGSGSGDYKPGSGDGGSGSVYTPGKGNDDSSSEY